jgi:hypothetical protein
MSKQRSMQDLVLLETRKVLQELFGDQFQPSASDLEAQRQKELEQSIRDRGVKKASDAKKEKINQNKKRKDEAEKEDKELEALLGDEGEEDKEDKEEEESADDAESDEGEEEAAEEEPKDDAAKVDKPAGKERTKGKWTADSPKLANPPDDVLRDPSFNDIKVAMDLFRGGKSTNDPKVKKYLQSYVGKLSTDERQAMFAFFMAAAQILSGKTKGKEAMEPSDIGVRMTPVEKGAAPAKKTDVAKSIPPSQIPAGTSTPIVVGESADKSLIKRILLSNR